MNINVTYSTNSSVSQAVTEIKDSLKGNNTNTIIYFASSNYSQDELSNSMQKSFSNAKVLGCSTAGEIISNKMLKNSIVAMGLSDEVISDAYVDVMDDIGDLEQVNTIFKSMEEYYGEKVIDMDNSKYFGMVIMDGMSGKEERVMERIGELTNIEFIGGSAGDDLKFKTTWVHAKGKAYSNAAIIAIFKSKAKFEVLKTQSFKTLDKILVATKVNEDNREVLEFNGKNAVEEYAQLLNTTVDNVASKFMTNPIGIDVDKENNEFFVRSPQQIIDGKIKFYCNILENMEVELLESTDIVEDTKEAVKRLEAEKRKVAGIINFHCILRTLELESKNQTKEYAEIFRDIPTIGFSSYGEAYIGHINQTSTMLVFYK